MADCRRCVYFTPADRLDPDTKARAVRWVSRRRPGSQLLGWCNAYGRPVTYYTGSCYRYTPREPKYKPITSYGSVEVVGNRS